MRHNILGFGVLEIYIFYYITDDPFYLMKLFLSHFLENISVDTDMNR